MKALRTETAALETRLGKLREAERLLSEIYTDRPAQPEAPAPKDAPVAAGRRPRAKRLVLSDQELVDKTRAALADGPRTTSQICQALGSNSGPVKARLRLALATLNAGKSGSFWSLSTATPAPDPGAPPHISNGHGHTSAATVDGQAEHAYLDRILLATLKRGLFPVELLAERLDARAGAIRDACRRLEREGTAQRSPDGMWTATA